MKKKNTLLQNIHNPRFLYTLITALIFIMLGYVFFLPHENVGFDQNEVITFG